jgi:glycosyltransferase involved in cell wall biosynthesis
VPSHGPLIHDLRAIDGIGVEVGHFRVLRKGLLSPARLVLLILAVPVDVWRAVRHIRRVGPDVVYVNTVTLPWWILAARLCRRPVLVHVREAESDVPRVLRFALAMPLLLATRVVTNSRASKRVLTDTIPGLARKTDVLYNGLPDPGPQDGPPKLGRLAFVGRLSPRKGVDVALEALALLRSDGRDLELDVCGSVYAGYEWYEEQLRQRAARPDLAGTVRFLGYVNPTGPVLGGAEVVLIPSRAEPFGNTAVEGLLARRPVVASDVQGLTEIIVHGRTGLLVPPGDAEALAAAVAKVLDDPAFAERLAHDGRQDALERFSLQRYVTDVELSLLSLI